MASLFDHPGAKRRPTWVLRRHHGTPRGDPCIIGQRRTREPRITLTLTLVCARRIRTLGMSEGRGSVQTGALASPWESRPARSADPEPEQLLCQRRARGPARVDPMATSRTCQASCRPGPPGCGRPDRDLTGGWRITPTATPRPVQVVELYRAARSGGTSSIKKAVADHLGAKLADQFARRRRCASGRQDRHAAQVRRITSPPHPACARAPTRPNTCRPGQRVAVTCGRAQSAAIRPPPPFDALHRPILMASPRGPAFAGLQHAHAADTTPPGSGASPARARRPPQPCSPRCRKPRALDRHQVAVVGAFNRDAGLWRGRRCVWGGAGPRSARSSTWPPSRPAQRHPGLPHATSVMSSRRAWPSPGWESRDRRE